MVTSTPTEQPVEERPPSSAWQRRTAEMRAVGQKIEKTSMGSAERLELLRRQGELADMREASRSRKLPRDI
jgi:hypothetical protein